MSRTATRALTGLGAALLCLAPGLAAGPERGERGDRAETRAPTTVSDEQLEQILKFLKIEYTRYDPPGEPKRPAEFDFALGDHTATIQSEAGGTVLVLGVNLKKYPRVTLEQVNRWNVDNILSRAVYRSRTDRDGSRVTYSRLEWDLDCSLGVTPQAVRTFIRSFEASVREYQQFLQKSAGGGAQE